MLMFEELLIKCYIINIRGTEVLGIKKAVTAWSNQPCFLPTGWKCEMIFGGRGRMVNSGII